MTASTVRHRRVSRLLLIAGVLALISGIAITTLPLAQMWLRTRQDDQALQQWRDGGSQQLVGPAPSASALAAGCTGGGDETAAYALVSFPSLPEYGYADIAGHGSWDLLTSRSMVHYAGTAGPGQQGNMIIAFHREPRYEHIDRLAVGDVLDVQDRNCTTYRYRVTARWDLPPEQVTQLVPTAGRDLTLVTCTPFWIDTRRLVWRASLIEP